MWWPSQVPFLCFDVAAQYFAEIFLEKKWNKDKQKELIKNIVLC